jgi:hypothetical protein
VLAPTTAATHGADDGTIDVLSVVAFSHPS